MEINEHDAGTPAAQADRGVRASVPAPSPKPRLWHRIGTLGWTKTAPAEPVRPTAGTPSRPVRQAKRRKPSVGESAAVAALGILLAGLIAVAFRGSWTAHRDAALSAHFDAVGADLYPFAPDGLIIIALIAAMVLRHSKGARFYSLTVVALFTGTSYVINHLHGLGWFAMKPGTHDLITPLPWGVVALVALQVIGAIFFGSHILVHVFRHLFPGVSDEPADLAPAAAPQKQEARQERTSDTSDSEGDTTSERLEQGEQRTADEELAERKKWAAVAYGLALDKDVTITKQALADAFQISTRQAGYVRADVDLEREQEAEREAEQQAAAEAAQAARVRLAEQSARPVRPADLGVREPTDEELTAGMAPAEMLTGPGITVLRQQWRERNAAALASSNGSGGA